VSLESLVVVVRDGGEARNTTLSPLPTTNTPLHAHRHGKEIEKQNPIQLPNRPTPPSLNYGPRAARLHKPTPSQTNPNIRNDVSLQNLASRPLPD